MSISRSTCPRLDSCLSLDVDGGRGLGASPGDTRRQCWTSELGGSISISNSNRGSSTGRGARPSAGIDSDDSRGSTCMGSNLVGVGWLVMCKYCRWSTNSSNAIICY